MTNTYTALATITLTSTDSSIDFANIPNTYRDLVMVMNSTQSADGQIRLQVNSDTGSNYSLVWMRGEGGATNSTSFTSTNVELSFTTAGLQNALLIQFMDYSATDKHKTILSRGSNVNYVIGTAARYASNTAISAVKVYPNSGTFSIGSTFSLYGIRS